MRSRLCCLFLLLFATPLFPAVKTHVITFGKALTVKLFLGPAEDHTMDMRVRGLYVDGSLKEFTTGETHDVTDRLFVVRKAYRLNDNLPDDSKTPHWKWQRGAWLMVDRITGRITPLKLPEFDPFYSAASWYRDYAAYCGISDNGSTLYAVVAEVGRKKPVLHKDLGAANEGDMPDSNCDAPEWERNPSKVTFLPKKFPKVSYTVFGHATDIANDNDDE
ncbi:MAG TPA: hypothetical protein VGL89_02885 [Candidatus Koribacter sp.]